MLSKACAEKNLTSSSGSDCISSVRHGRTCRIASQSQHHGSVGKEKKARLHDGRHKTVSLGLGSSRTGSNLSPTTFYDPKFNTKRDLRSLVLRTSHMQQAGMYNSRKLHGVFQYSAPWLDTANNAVNLNARASQLSTNPSPVSRPPQRRGVVPSLGGPVQQ